VTDLTPVNRPMTLPELAVGFGVDVRKLRRLADPHGVGPACRIASVPVYGPKQIRALYALLAAVGPARAN
jgi:hypothetical protein